jgi:nitrite reductase/ring-hydroxylating ferredoxin subunit
VTEVAQTGGGGSDEPLIQLDEVPVGGAKGVTAGNGDKVIVTRPTEGEAVAFDATCPHQGCTVAPDDGQLSCPCHGSQFELDGSLKKGPARRAWSRTPCRSWTGRSCRPDGARAVSRAGSARSSRRTRRRSGSR